MAENTSQQTRQRPPEAERHPAAALIEAARALFDSTPDIVAGALATAPDRKTFSVDEAKELIAAREKVVIDPYAGVPETYPIPEGHLDGLSKREADASGPAVQARLRAREGASA